METFIIITLGVSLIAALLYIIYLRNSQVEANLLMKDSNDLLERAEEKFLELERNRDDIHEKAQGLVDFIAKLSEVLQIAQTHLVSLDEKGTFRSDDEIGFYFEQLEKVQSEINNFINPIEEDGKKEEQ